MASGSGKTTQPKKKAGDDIATVEKEFEAAVKLITKGPAPGTNAPKIEVSNEQKLQFYGLFKQATVGPNTTKPPGRLDIINRAKWNAWKDVTKLSKLDAKKAYVALVAKANPDWRKYAGLTGETGKAKL